MQEMRTFRENISWLMREKGISQKEMAKLIGVKTQTGVSYMLTGKSDINREMLNAMCEVLGITVVELATISSDLKVAKTAEAVQAAAIMDSLTPENRDLALALLRQMASKK